MSRNYSLEDVETLRAKASISYEDAVALLDKYDGDLARALIELEKRGQLSGVEKGAKINMDDVISRIKSLWRKGLTTRIVVERKGIQLMNLSVSFLLLMTLLGVYAMICALILSLVSGCSISLKKTVEETVTAEEPIVQAAPAQPEATQHDSDDYHSFTIS